MGGSDGDAPTQLLFAEIEGYGVWDCEAGSPVAGDHLNRQTVPTLTGASIRRKPTEKVTVTMFDPN